MSRYRKLAQVRDHAGRAFDRYWLKNDPEWYKKLTVAQFAEMIYKAGFEVGYYAGHQEGRYAVTPDPGSTVGA